MMRRTNWSRRALIAGLAIALALVMGDGLPAAAQEEINFTSEGSCSPEAFRPNEWTVVECVTILKNNGDRPLSDIRGGMVSSEGVIPQFFFVSSRTNGQLTWIDPMSTNVGGEGVLPPGQSAEIRITVLLRMASEGVYEGQWEQSVEGQVISVTPRRFEANAGAADPPRTLEVSRRIIAGGEGQGKVAYETTITNQGSSPINSLSFLEHWGRQAQLLDTTPPFYESMAGIGYATWNLPSFGKESLGPGESIVLETAFASTAAYGECAPVQMGGLLEAVVDGALQRYGVRGQDVSVGTCSGEDGGAPGGDGDGRGEPPPGAVPSSGGETPPVEAPATGDGPSLGGTSHSKAAAAALAVAGITLIAAAMRRAFKAR